MITRYALPGTWNDVIVLRDGTFALVSTTVGQRPARCDSTTGLLWTFDAAEAIHYLRAATVPSGDTLVIGQGHDTGAVQCYVVSAAGVAARVPLGVICVGQNGAVVGVRGPSWYVAVMTSSREWRDWIVSPDGVATPLVAHPVPTWWAGGDGSTSQGWLDAQGVTLIWTDQNWAVTTADGRRLSRCGYAGDVAVVGQGDDGAYLSLDRQTSSLVLPGLTYDPHIVQSGDRYAVCSWSPAGIQWAVIAPPYPEPTPIPPPPIVIPPPVVVPPVSAPPLSTPPPVVVPPMSGPLPESQFWHGLTAGDSSDDIGSDWIQEMADRGVTLDRVDCCNKPTTKAIIASIAAKRQRTRMQPLYLGDRTVMRLLPDGSWFEFWSGSPPKQGDTGGSSVSGTQYAQEACEVLDYAKDHHLIVFFGVLDNLNAAWLGKGNFLDQFITEMTRLGRWPEVKNISAHYYPNKDGSDGHDGRTMRGCMDWLRSWIGPDRLVLMTEVGCHNAPSMPAPGIGAWLARLVRLGGYRAMSEQAVLDRYRQYETFFRAQKNVIGWCIYQLIDALKSAADYNSPIARCGLREANGDVTNGVNARWKAQSNVWVKAA